MKKILLILMLGSLVASAATTQSFTEFYVQTTGNNLNSGSDSSDTPKCLLTGGYWTNNTTSGVFRKDSSTFTNVAVGDWASVYPDAVDTNTVFVGLITATNATNVTISLTAKSGTAPATDETGATTIRVGGAWAGPNTNSAISAAGFPFGFVQNTMTNASGDVPSVNFVVGTYHTTNALSLDDAGPIVWSGYSTTPRDGGRATISGNFAGTSFSLCVITGGNNILQDFIFSKNGTGAASVNGVYIGSTENILRNLTVTGMRRTGLSAGGTINTIIGCEIYGCNIDNISSNDGVRDNSGGNYYINCISYSNTTANSSGFYISGAGANFLNCISYRNGASGFVLGTTTYTLVSGCDAYANAANGFDLSGSSANTVLIKDCNAFDNGTFGFNSSGSSIRSGLIVNCNVGSGTMTNNSGNFGPKVTDVQNGTLIENITLLASDTTPWVDPDASNFTINNASNKAAGYGIFTHSYATLSAFPDVGAIQNAATNAAASSASSHTFAQ